ncbi:hypothetical protein [uncultured Chitinophaga sp.]|uniref:hypothetical protein n=1 Tax=uncultured Chitinophaga sp. TaxID=339340 RepID=UPI00262FED38|nr:hypothetical protein [uncultured Chitinophaga sp.]
MRLGTDYISQCRENFFLGITPSCDSCQTQEGYVKLDRIAAQLMADIGALEFSGYFQESQYLVDLWTAHMILKHADVNLELKNKCLSIIKDYSTTPLSETVAKEESLWLAKKLI